jgi:hypothetical protein
MIARELANYGLARAGRGDQYAQVVTGQAIHWRVAVWVARCGHL